MEIFDVVDEYGRTPLVLTKYKEHAKHYMTDWVEKLIMYFYCKVAVAEKKRMR